VNAHTDAKIRSVGTQHPWRACCCGRRRRRKSRRGRRSGRRRKRRKRRRRWRRRWRWRRRRITFNVGRVLVLNTPPACVFARGAEPAHGVVGDLGDAVARLVHRDGAPLAAGPSK
jgi:hypothetical protein